MRKMILSLLITFFVLGSALAQTKLHEESFVFKFVSGKDMFYVPYGGNDVSLEQIIALIEKDRELLESGKMYISVASYATKGNKEQNARKVAYIQRNRIKSELITRCKITEETFVTDHYITEPYNGLKNVVVVSIPTSVEKIRELLGDEKADVVARYYKSIEDAKFLAEQKRVDAENAEIERLAREKAERERLAREKRLAEERAEQERLAQKQAEAEKMPQVKEENDKNRLSPFTIRTNLLYFAGGLFNAGVEYKTENCRLGYLVNGGYSPFGNTEWNKNLGGWFITPELRYYLGEKQAWFVGAQFLAGGYNYKMGHTGYQGSVLAGGVTGGYKLALSKCLDMDFSLGLGYGSLHYDKYIHTEKGNNIRTEKGIKKNTIMPIQAGVSLIFKL